MDSRSAVSVLVGVVVAVASAAAGPTLAAGVGSTGQSAGLAPDSIRTAGTCTPGARACPIRITFAEGAYGGQAHSRLTGIHSQKWFVVRARADQTMIVIVKGRGPTRGTVYFPNGGSSGQPGGRVFDDVLTSSGDYRIRVEESPMGEAWSGRVDVVAVIY